jgi:hypothetical protein
MTYPTWAVIMDTAPRSKQVSWYIGKLDTDFDYPFYRVWAKCSYSEEAITRVRELNGAQR